MILEVVWSGAKEKAGEAGGLSSPLIGSAARLCMEHGGHALKDGPLVPAYRPKRRLVCRSCGRYARGVRLWVWLWWHI